MGIQYRVNQQQRRQQEQKQKQIKYQVAASGVPMRYCPFRQFVLSGKNRYDINHAVVQKVVPRKIREPF